jgi:hypothetical protein
MSFKLLTFAHRFYMLPNAALYLGELYER